MSTNKETKINHLLQNTPPGTIMLASWLSKNGYSHHLQQRYKKSMWIEAVGQGAFKRTGDTVDIYGAIYALQFQAGKTLHVGGRSSLALQGYAHYIEMQQNDTVIFTIKGMKLPAWFMKNQWNSLPVVVRSSFLPPNLGISDHSVKSFNISISTPARAIMECFEMSPVRFDLMEAYLIMEGLNALNPSEVQILLEKCNSIKVKRLFLYFAEKADHAWFKYLDTNKINLGSGKRSLVQHGSWVKKYQITVPESLA